MLRRLVDSDADCLASLANNRKIWDNVRDYFPHPYTEEHAENFIDFTGRENPALTFGVEYKGSLVGVAGLVNQTDVYRLSAEIGFWIGEPCWGKGIAPKAVDLLVSYGFSVLKLIRIYAGIFEYNKASQRVLEKCGFEKEGVFKNSVIKNGKIYNEIRFGITKPTSDRH